MTKKYYLAGPMSGHPQFNIPLFTKAAALLRSMGYNIVNPCELDSAPIRDACLASEDGKPSDDLPSWGVLLGRDVCVVADMCDGIIFLPGWSRSRGALLEATTALFTGKKEYFQLVLEEAADGSIRRFKLDAIGFEDFLYDVVCGARAVAIRERLG